MKGQSLPACSVCHLLGAFITQHRSFLSTDTVSHHSQGQLYQCECSHCCQGSVLAQGASSAFPILNSRSTSALPGWKQTPLLAASEGPSQVVWSGWADARLLLMKCYIGKGRLLLVWVSTAAPAR